MKDFSQWVDDELKPQIFSNADILFPQLHFEKCSTGWRSSKNIDGSENPMHKKDRTYITSSRPFLAGQNGGGNPQIELITLYAQLNHHSTDRVETIKAIAKALGMDVPEADRVGAERWQKSQQKQDSLQASAHRQQEALYTKEGEQVLNYLTQDRGFSEEFIRWAGFGYLSEAEAKALAALTKVDDKEGINIQQAKYYPLSFPFVYRERIKGFKFRTLDKEQAEKYGKYRNTAGLSKGSLLYRLSVYKEKAEDIILVEGEIDCLRAEYALQLAGIKEYGTAATTGGALSFYQAKEAALAGVRRITLLLDNDTSGKDFIEPSIKAARANNISILVAELPEGFKDVDEFLKEHTAEELKQVVEIARGGAYYLCFKKISEFYNKHSEGYPEAKEMALRDEIIEIATEYSNNEVEAEAIFSEYSNNFAFISAEALRKVANRQAVKKAKVKQAEGLKTILEEGKKLSDEGETDELFKLLRGEKVEELYRKNRRAEFTEILQKNSYSVWVDGLKEQGEQIETSLSFYNTLAPEDVSKRIEYPFTIPTGAITIIAAPTSHGKSTLLRNLAIDVARRSKEEEGSILYFTFEEEEIDVISQFLNTFIGENLHSHSENHPHIETLKRYFRTGSLKGIREDKVALLKEKKEEFFNDYINTGKLRIIYKDYDINKLVEALYFVSEEIKVKAIFIDYIQLLRKAGYRQGRTEELKEITIALKNFAVETHLPIILAAQLNRDVTTPLRMTNQNLAESSDIEKAANTIICLWNSKWKPPYGNKGITGKEEEQEISKLSAEGFNMGTQGKIFAKITKRRGGVSELYTILNYNGDIGLVTPYSQPQPYTEQDNSPQSRKKDEDKAERYTEMPY